jgi:hypothetical protein
VRAALPFGFCINQVFFNCFFDFFVVQVAPTGWIVQHDFQTKATEFAAFPHHPDGSHVGPPLAGNPLWLHSAFAFEAYRPATRTAQPWHIVDASPFAACWCDAALPTSNDCGVRCVERTFMSVFCSIALRAMKQEKGVPTGPFIIMEITWWRGLITGRPTTSDNRYWYGLGSPVAVQDIKPRLSKGEMGWGRFQF